VLTDKISAAQRELAQLKHQNALLKDETTSLKSELEMLQVCILLVMTLEFLSSNVFSYFCFVFSVATR
jgi:hypothetical protein